jgi:hypothetical protein
MKVVRIFYRGDEFLEAYLHCEFCGNDEITRRHEGEEEFIEKVLPTLKCSRCNKSSE